MQIERRRRRNELQMEHRINSTPVLNELTYSPMKLTMNINFCPRDRY